LINLYHQRNLNQGFWRTYNGQEIDLVEQSGGTLAGYEIKWQSARTSKPPTAWLKDYPHASHAIINQDNYLPFITI
jgi:hypothetical protein